MAGKFVVLEEAAEMLGIPAEKLNEMREQREVSGYRDGKSWKFKKADIEKLRASLGSGGSTPKEDDELALQLDDDLSEIDLSQEMSDSGALTDPSITPSVSDDLDLALDDDLGLAAEEPTPEVADAENAPTLELESSELGLDDIDLGDDLNLAEEDKEDALGLAPEVSEEPTPEPPADDSPALADDSPKEPVAEATAADDLDLALDHDIDLALTEEQSGSSSTHELDLLGEEESDDKEEILLGGDDADLTLEDDDDGISLMADEGASAELQLDDDDFDVGASDALSDDLDDEDLILGDDSAEDELAPTKAASEDDFELTPMVDADAELSDSGSQVIALDSSEEFADLGGEFAAEGDAATDEGAFGSTVGDDFGSLGGAASRPAAKTVGTATAEAPYSTLNIVSLVFCSILLLIVGFMMIDLMRNLGTWNGPASLNKTLMDVVLDALGM